MATLVVIASTGDITGSVTRIQEYNLNPYDADHDWEQIGTQIRNAVAAAVNIEENEQTQAEKDRLKAAYEEGRRDVVKDHQGDKGEEPTLGRKITEEMHREDERVLRDL